MNNRRLFIALLILPLPLFGASVSNVNVGFDPAIPSPDHDLVATYTTAFNPNAGETGVKVVFDWKKGSTSIAVLNMPFEQSTDSSGFPPPKNLRTKDYSWHSNSGTEHNDVSWSGIGAYDWGGYFNFDGVNDYISVAHDASLNLNHFTLEARVKADTFGGSRALISKGIYPRPASLWLTGNRVQVWWDTGTGSSRIMSAASLSAGTWYHIAATYDGTTLRLYINGVLDSTATPSSPPPFNNQQLVFGQRGDNAFWFDGKLDEIRIFPFALSADQIAEFANGTPDDRIKASETNMGETWYVTLTPNGRLNAQSNKDGLSITSAPITIDTPVCDFLLTACKTTGWVSNSTYCLGANIQNVAGSCMVIPPTVSNVTLNCTGFDPNFHLIDGDHDTNPAAPAFDHGILIDSQMNGAADNITITNCTVKDFDYGIFLNGYGTHYAANPTFTNNVIQNNFKWGLWAGGFSNNGLASGNLFKGNGGAGGFNGIIGDLVLGVDNLNWMITNNTFDGDHLVSDRRGLVLGMWDAPGPTLTVSGNQFSNYDSLDAAAIWIHATNGGAQIHDNVFTGNYWGIVLEDSDNVIWNNAFFSSIARHVVRTSLSSNVFSFNGAGNYWDDFNCIDLAMPIGICDNGPYDTGILFGEPNAVVDPFPKANP